MSSGKLLNNIFILLVIISNHIGVLMNYRKLTFSVVIESVISVPSRVIILLANRRI